MSARPDADSPLQPAIRSGSYRRNPNKRREPAKRLPIDPERVNKRTGRMEAVRPTVESIGAYKVYAERFGELCIGKGRAFISGPSVLFGDGLREYSLEAVPGGYAMLFNTADTSEGVLIGPLLDLATGNVTRARELIAPLAEALKALGFEVPDPDPPPRRPGRYTRRDRTSAG